MTRLLIGNDFDENLRADRRWTGWWVQRLIWFARDGDVLVLPTAADDAFFRYATALTGTDLSSLQVIVPPVLEAEQRGLLTPERLRHEALLAELRSAVAGRRVEEVLPLWPDAAVAELAARLGIGSRLAGGGFMSQGGGRIANSKSIFRAIGEGLGVPLPRGAVCWNRRQAEHAAWQLLDAGRSVIVKQDHLSGGRGNEILSPGETFRPIGARRVVAIAGRPALEAYMDERWQELRGPDHHAVVVEEYFRDSRAYFAEFMIDDSGIELRGTGELLSAPFAVGQVMPAPQLEAAQMHALVSGGSALCEALRAMGYRGRLSADAVLTPRGSVYFTEYNGRITGSTHIYAEIGETVIGEGYGRDRLILERVWPPGWSVASFSDALAAVRGAGLGYERSERSGVIFTNAYDDRYGGVMYCVAAPSLDEAWRVDRRLAEVFARG